MSLFLGGIRDSQLGSSSGWADGDNMILYGGVWGVMHLFII